jgi:hypothetical protein
MCGHSPCWDPIPIPSRQCSSYGGSRWTRVPDARISSEGAPSFPFGLAFSGPDDGWFIGNITSDGRHILAEHWDGSTWSADSVANLGIVDAVAAVPGGGYWAVGEYVSIRGYTQTLMLHHP